MSCSMNRMVSPSSSRILRIRWVSSCVSFGFIPAVGSSMSTSLGPEAMARAISSRRRLAYDRDIEGWSNRQPTRRVPKKASASSALLRVSSSSLRNRGVRRMAPRAPDFVRACRASITFSRTVISGNSRTFWNVRAMPKARIWLGRRLTMLRSSKRMLPPFGWAMPLIMLNRVVLPAPFGPITLTISPLSTWRSRPSIARTPPKSLVSWVISRSAILRASASLEADLGRLAPMGLDPCVLEHLVLAELASPPPARDESLGPSQHHEDQEGSIDQEPERLELLQDLREAAECQRRENDAGNTSHSSHDDDGEDRDRNDDVEAVREDRSGFHGKERPTDARDDGSDHERPELRRHDVDAHRLSDGLVLPDGHPGPSEARVLQRIRCIGRHDGKAEDQVEEGLRVRAQELDRPHVDTRDSDDAQCAAEIRGQPRGRHQEARDLAETERHDGEIVPPHPEHRGPHEEARKGGGEKDEREGFPEDQPGSPL